MSKIEWLKAEPLIQKWQEDSNYILKNRVKSWSFKEKDMYDLWTQSNSIVLLRLYLSEKEDGSTGLIAVALEGQFDRNSEGGIDSYDTYELREGIILEADLIDDDIAELQDEHSPLNQDIEQGAVTRLDIENDNQNSVDEFLENSQHNVSTVYGVGVTQQKRVNVQLKSGVVRLQEEPIDGIDVLEDDQSLLTKSVKEYIIGNIPVSRTITMGQAKSMTTKLRARYQKEINLYPTNNQGDKIKAWNFSISNLNWLYHHWKKNLHKVGYFKFYLATKPDNDQEMTLIMLLSDKNNKDMIEERQGKMGINQLMDFAEPCPPLCCCS